MPGNQDRREIHDIYIIPPNFIESGTFMGGMLKVRNTLEAGAIALCIGFPVFHLPLGLTAKIIVCCLTVLPLSLLALIGIAGESLSSFIINFFRFLRYRRVLYHSNQEEAERDTEASRPARPQRQKRSRKPRRPLKEDFPDEFGGERTERRRARKQAAKAKAAEEQPEKLKAGRHISAPPRQQKVKSQKAVTVEEFLPVKKIENGVVYMTDGRYVRILEVEPINFLLRSSREQKNIIYSFVSYLKISTVKLQIKVLTRKADINRHIEHVRREMQSEQDERCRLLQEDYINLVQRIGSREAITRRFFLIFEFEPFSTKNAGESEAIAALETATTTARNYFRQCGNSILEHDNEDEFQTEVFYDLLNRRSCQDKPLSARVNEVVGRYIAAGNRDKIDDIPVCEFMAPASIDFTNGHYVKMDGLYHAFLLVPSTGYKSHVSAGWISLLVNAGEGIDTDIFFHRQQKDKIILKLGQQLRINRSKIKETSDTNTDYDDLESAISSGYFLKDGLSQNQDFYYMSILVTVTAESPDELEWRVNEMKKLMISQDLDVMPCTFRGEQALLSALPVASLDKVLYEKSKRNALTMGVASCYPFVSYEVSDDNGILLGINKHNNSLVITDIFNTRVYKNANICIAGCTGAGKTFLLQTLALRMRRRGIHTYIIAPIKGHEFARACKNIGGAFIPISPASDLCINIMEIRKLDKTAADLLDGAAANRSELAAKIQQLHIFFSLLIPDMSHEERQLLDEAMVQTYNAMGITHDNESLTDPEDPTRYKTMPILGDLHKVLLKKPETKRIANILNRLVNGSAKTFNQQTNVPLNNAYTVLDLSDLTGDLLPVGMFVALDYVWDKVKEDRTLEKAVIIDELWELIGASSNRLAANFTLEVAKLIRAFGGSGIFATQDLNDFFALDDGKYGKGVLNACKTKIILNLEDEEAQRVQSVLHLSESEYMAITHFERGNGLIISNNNTITVEFKASELETELITTDRRELQQLLQKKREQNLD